MGRVGLILASLLLTGLVGCANVHPIARVGIYHKVDDYKWNQDSSKTVFIGTLGVADDHWECGYTHISDPERGTPFNDKQEAIATELVGCAVGWW